MLLESSTIFLDPHKYAMVCGDYSFTTTFIRKIKTKYGTYLAEVRSVRVDADILPPMN
ncbi:MAG: hypothetical protein M0Z77_04830 [Thermoplasmatales archaeon]|jgi:hypothetical protein|nr:hypothetical protein [Candidatus Thermoplasmatota archaeon]MDA8054960.1 hypothetical protein [Thermoplasmatales archaeon]